MSNTQDIPRVEVTDGSVQKGDILTYELTDKGLGKILSHTRAMCEICCQRPGEHDLGFEGIACDECKSQWTESVIADDTASLSLPSRNRSSGTVPE
jgi:hypothetical protein